jgi:hypothetical protein
MTSRPVAPLDDNVPPAVWQEVASRVDPNHQLLTGPWLEAWARHLVPRGDWLDPVRYAVARDEAREILAVVPFAVQKVAIFRFQSLAGYYFPFRCLPVARGREKEAAIALSSILDRIPSGLGFRFGPVERNDASVAALVEVLTERGWTTISRGVGDEFLVRLPGTIEVFRASLSRNLRTNVPYKERRMKREGRVTIAFLNGATGAAWQEAISFMGEVESLSWVGRSGGHLHFRDERNARFWGDFLAAPGPSRAARAWLLSFNDRPGAFYFCVDSGECRYFIAGLYADPVARYSPGYLLMQHMLEDAIRNGLRTVNLGAGDAGYKSRWGARPDRQLEDWVALRPGLLGKGLSAAWYLRNRLKRKAKELEEPEEKAPD